jgi:hypothetical protein
MFRERIFHPYGALWIILFLFYKYYAPTELFGLVILQSRRDVIFIVL